MVNAKGRVPDCYYLRSRRDVRLSAERHGWEVVEIYNNAGISGAKGRKDRPALA
jgi:hypothetical protein